MGKAYLTALCMAYNEERLLPLWCAHYWQQEADRLVVLYDVTSTDRTAEVALLGGAEVIPVRSPSGLMDDEWKSATLSEYARVQTVLGHESWVLVCDADEFAYPIIGGTIHDQIEAAPGGTVCYAIDYWQAYRHVSEGPIDSRPVLNQRRHGSPSPFGQGHWNKPALVNVSRLRPEWAPGHHTLLNHPAPEIQKGYLRGAHWAMADVDLAIERRIKGRRERQSQENYQRGMTSHNWHVTEQEIRDECEAHQHDEKQV